MFSRRAPRQNRSRIQSGGQSVLPLSSLNIFGTTFDVVKQVDTAVGIDDINAVVHRRDAICYDPVNDIHYMGYYRSSDAQVVIGKKIGPTGVWAFTVSTATIIAITDDHKAISLAVQSNGKLVVSYGVHGEQLNFWRAPVAGDTQITNATLIAGPSAGPLVAGMAAIEANTTYPGFRRYSDGELMFMFRNGGSNNGDDYVYSIIGDVITSKGKIYDGATGSSPVCNFYWNTPFVEPSTYPHPNRLWVATQIRYTPAASSARGLYCHYSDDRGTTWKAYDGTAQTLPITNLNCSAALWEDVNADGSAANYDAMQAFTVDSDGRPIASAYYGSQLYCWRYDGTTNNYGTGLGLGVRKAQMTLWGSSVAGASRPMALAKTNQQVVVMYAELSASDGIGRLTYSTADLPNLTNVARGVVRVLNNKNDVLLASPLHDSRLWDGGNGSLEMYWQQTAINGVPYAAAANGPSVLRVTVGGTPTFQDPIAIDGAAIAWYVNGDNKTLNAGAVSQLSDLTSNALHFTAAGSAQPLWVANGLGTRGTCLFDGSNDVLATANQTKVAPATTARFFYLIARINTWTANDIVMSHCDGAGAGLILNMSAVNDLRSWYGLALSTTNPNAPPGAGNWRRIMMIQTGSTTDELIIGSGRTARCTGVNTGNVAVTARPIALGGAPLLAGRFGNVEIACAFERTGIPSDETIVLYDSYFCNYYGTDVIFT